MDEDTEKFAYASYVQDIMGPMCFDFGFGPFRWVCTSADPKDLEKTDTIACNVLEEIRNNAPQEIQQQLTDNIQWIKGAQENKLVVGSQARILYADAEGRAKLYADIAHPINSGCREMIQNRVIEEFHLEQDRAKQPGYVSRYDDFDIDDVVPAP